MNHRIALLAGALLAVPALFAQLPNTGSVVTGQLQLLRTVNLSQIASSVSSSQSVAGGTTAGPETPRFKALLPPPPLVPRPQVTSFAQLPFRSMSVSSLPGGLGFDGLTHSDQRLANSLNQFSIEPPNPSIAVANGMVLEGVNDAVRVYTTAGTPLVPTVSSNQLFGLAPAIDRTVTPYVYGVFLTDMRVFYDQDTSRWFVLQRSQDEDTSGNPLSQSHIYLAASQTSDPTGVYNIYVMDTTDANNGGCPCFDDYPQIGADRYGLYISSNEYGIADPNNPQSNGAVVLAISKADLRAGVNSPTAVRFPIASFTGYEFGIQPASTPPGASPFVAGGGVEFFVSSYPNGFDSYLALWSLSNTASLQSANPALLMSLITVPTLPHVPPPFSVRQRSGPRTLAPDQPLERLDAGAFSDSRVLATSYSGGRLFVTLATSVFDSNQNNVAGGLYVIFSPTFRNGVLGATPPVKQGYIAATSNNILRPAIAVNAQGKGAIAFTLSGPDYYPSAAFVSIDTTTAAPSDIRIAGAGAMPEDGFSGYGPIPVLCPNCNGFGVARWGDYSTAVATADGSIWLVSEYIPNIPRSPLAPLANWGTFVSQYVP